MAHIPHWVRDRRQGRAVAKILEARDTFEEAVAMATTYPQDAANAQFVVAAGVAEVQASEGETFEETVAVASTYPPAATNARFVREVHHKFQRLVTEAQALEVTAARLESLVEAAENLARVRAYLYPQPAIRPAVDTAMRDLEDWGVPADAIGRIKEQIVARLDKDSKDTNTARAILRSMWEEYDGWSEYIDKVSARLNRYGWILFFSVLATLFISINRFVAGDVIFGFVVAGFSGALTSVMLKFPPVSGYGVLSDARRRILGRIATGLLAAVVGVGVVASGIVAVQIPLLGSTATVADIIERCGKSRTTKSPEAQTSASTPSTTSTSQVSDSVTAGDTAKRAASCTTGNIFLLMGLAIVLGFAERGLPTFADKLLPGAKDAPEEKRGTQTAKTG